MRGWLKALNLKKPPKRPFVCSYHFVDGKPTPEHPYPEKWLGYGLPLKKSRRGLDKLTSPPPSPTPSAPSPPSPSPPEVCSSEEETRPDLPPDVHCVVVKEEADLSISPFPPYISCCALKEEATRIPDLPPDISCCIKKEEETGISVLPPEINCCIKKEEESRIPVLSPDINCCIKKEETKISVFPPNANGCVKKEKETMLSLLPPDVSSSTVKEETTSISLSPPAPSSQLAPLTLPAIIRCVVTKKDNRTKPYIPPDHAYAASPLDQPLLTCNRSTQCSGPPELHAQLLRSDHLCLLYTGLPLSAFHSLCDQLLKDYKNCFQLDPRDQILMTVMKLRLNLLQDDLAERFRLSQSQVSKITSAWYDIMDEKMKIHIPWLPRETIQATMPKCFKDHYPTTTCVIDCCETPLQKPYTFGLRGQNTIKYLLALAPCGLIMFISSGHYGGKYTDNFITKNCGFLDNLRPGDAVMADKEFHISELLHERNVELIVPDFTKKGAQQSEEEDSTNTKRGIDIRVHIERVIRRFKRFSIISQTVPICLAHKFGKILRICAALANLSGDIVQEDEDGEY